MVEQVSYLFLAYSYLSAAGLGLVLLTAPRPLREPVVMPVIAPLVGFGVTSVAGSYAIALNRPVREALLAALVPGAAALAVAFYRDRSACRELPRDLANALWRHRGAAAVIVALVVLVGAPGAWRERATASIRYGPDVVGYAQTARFLHSGGTLESAEDRLLAAVGTSDLEMAKRRNAEALDVNTYIQSEFLLKALRWGYPATVAMLTELVGAPHVYSLVLNLAVLSLVLAAALLAWAARRHLGLGRRGAMVVALVYILNCNVLNVLYEGQYAQVYAAPFLVVLVVVLMQLRRSVLTPGAAAPAMTEEDERPLKVVAFVSLLVAPLLVAFTEVVLVFGAILGLVAVTDLLTRRRIDRRSLAVFGAGSFAALAITGPFSFRWLRQVGSIATGVETAGWWQPQWALPAEIVGLSDMYRGINDRTAYRLLERTALDATLNVAVSIALCVGVVVFVRLAAGSDRSLLLAGPLFVLLMFAKVHFLDEANNYQYMKAYTLAAPLVVLTLAAAACFFARLAHGNAAVAVRFIGLAALLVATATGVRYWNHFQKTSDRITGSWYALGDASNRGVFRKASVVVYASPLRDLALAPLVDFRWLNREIGTTGVRLGPHRNKEVLFIVDKDHIACAPCIARRHPRRVVFDNAQFLVVTTRQPVLSFVDQGTGKFVVPNPEKT